MNELLIGASVGMPAGALLASVVAVAILRHRDDLTEPMSAQDRSAVAQEFKTHAEAMQRQVSEYADALAAGDLVLRERLRQFERGW